MVSRFSGRNIIEKPFCPFCGQLIPPPKELAERMPSEMPVGSCTCGASYAYDVTGHNLGAAMIDALVFACNGDWDLAWGLLPGEDYLEKQVENYDLDTHSIVSGAVYQGRRITGTLFFIRLHKDVREVTEEGAKRRLARATPLSPGQASRQGPGAALSKSAVEKMVREYDLGPLLNVAGQDRRIIRNLQRLLYSPDKQFRYRACDVLGKVSAVIARENPGTISRLLLKLFAALSDTAASSWGSLDAIGDIIKNCPQYFAGYTPQLFQYAGDRELLPDVLRALGKIAESRPDVLRKKAFHFVPLLQDPDPEIRGYAALLLGNLGAGEAAEDLEKLSSDMESVEIYSEGILETRTIAQVAIEAMQKL
jgi:hypothetical protein